jgi:LEA14-like dessication related protein
MFDVFKINVWGYHSDVEYDSVQLGIESRTFRSSVIPPSTGYVEERFTVLSQAIMGEDKEDMTQF